MMGKVKTEVDPVASVVRVKTRNFQAEVGFKLFSDGSFIVGDRLHFPVDLDLPGQWGTGGGGGGGSGGSSGGTPHVPHHPMVRLAEYHAIGSPGVLSCRVGSLAAIVSRRPLSFVETSSASFIGGGTGVEARKARIEHLGSCLRLQKAVAVRLEKQADGIEEEAYLIEEEHPQQAKAMRVQAAELRREAEAPLFQAVRLEAKIEGIFGRRKKVPEKKKEKENKKKEKKGKKRRGGAEEPSAGEDGGEVKNKTGNRNGHKRQ